MKIQLFLERSESAISEISKKYGSFFFKISNNIIHNRQDSEECVSDGYLAAWNSIPPLIPDPLVTYICRLVRNASIKKYHSNKAQKRNSYYDVALDELEYFLVSYDTPDKQVELNETIEEINKFLGILEEQNRRIFVLRYWHGEPVWEIAKTEKSSENQVSARLFRMRKKLQKELQKN